MGHSFHPGGRLASGSFGSKAATRLARSPSERLTVLTAKTLQRIGPRDVRRDAQRRERVRNRSATDSNPVCGILCLLRIDVEQPLGIAGLLQCVAQACISGLRQSLQAHETSKLGPGVIFDPL